MKDRYDELDSLGDLIAALNPVIRYSLVGAFAIAAATVIALSL